jgi:hypothetical protein
MLAKMTWDSEKEAGERPLGGYQTAKGGNRMAITPSTKSELLRGISLSALRYARGGFHL